MSITTAKSRIRPDWTTNESWPTFPPTKTTAAKVHLLLPTLAPSTPEDFHQSFEIPSRPALFTNLCASWPAMNGGNRSWSLSNLRERLSPAQEFQVGCDWVGETVCVDLNSYETYMDTNQDRNPFIIFDSMIIERLHEEYEMLDKNTTKKKQEGRAEMKTTSTTSTQSNEIAREWYTKAAKQGNEIALKNLKSLDTSEGKTTPTFLLCSTCGTPDTADHKLKPCKQCHTAHYCNKKCQTEHWKTGGHRTECAQLKTTTVASTSFDLSQDFQVPPIFNCDDLLSLLPSEQRPPYQWLIIGPARSGSPVHTDPMATSAWNALLSGKKRWIFFHPDTPKELLTTHTLDLNARHEFDRDDLWDDVWGWFNEELNTIKDNVDIYFEEQRKNDGEETTETHVEQDLERHPWYMECVQNPGDIVYVPSMWHHAVFNVEDSIAVTQNYCSRINLTSVLREMEDQDLKKVFVQRLKEKRPELSVV